MQVEEAPAAGTGRFDGGVQATTAVDNRHELDHEKKQVVYEMTAIIECLRQELDKQKAQVISSAEGEQSSSLQFYSRKERPQNDNPVYDFVEEVKDKLIDLRECVAMANEIALHLSYKQQNNPNNITSV